VLDIYRYEIIDWDDPEVDPDPATNNLLHCQQADHLGPQAELIVAELFRGWWAEVRFRTQTAEYSVVGWPCRTSGSYCWRTHTSAATGCGR